MRRDIDVDLAPGETPYQALDRIVRLALTSGVSEGTMVALIVARAKAFADPAWHVPADGGERR